MAFLLAAWIAIAPAALASEADVISQLATSRGWLKLGHYERHAAGGMWRSTIHPGDFFLTASGATNPDAELQATIAALNAAPGEDPNQHAQCRFPARLQWLRSHLDAGTTFRTDIRCPNYDEWTQAGGVTSISVVLATGFLGNPASYYGHTLLKFNRKSNEGHVDLLDESASYGAIMDGKHDNPFTYIIKSLAHGYDAGFSNIRFYYHDHNYGNHELRDLWEYRLDLSPADRNLVVAHTWEVLGKRYTYEFFQGNCALRMAEILEILEDVKVAPHRPWIIPQALIQGLSAARYHGHPLVGEVVYHPSRQSRFYEKYQNLTAAERSALQDQVESKQDLESPQFEALPINSQQVVVDALLDYHQFVHNPIAQASPQAQADYAAALAMRYQLPPGEPAVAARAPDSPGDARPPGWLQLGSKHNSQTGDIHTLRVRAAYYDALDYDSGHVRFGSLVMGDLQLEMRHDSLRIGHFDLARIESVNPGISGLPGDHGAAWKLAVGAEQARLFCNNCLVGRAQADIGQSRLLANGLWGAVYAGAVLQTGAAGQGFGFARTSATVIMGIGHSARARVGYEWRIPVGTGTGGYGVGQAELRWAVSKRIDLRLRFDHDGTSEIGAGAGYYW